MSNKTTKPEPAAKTKPKKRKAHFHPTYLREKLGRVDDAAVSLEKNPLYEDSKAFADQRVAYQPDLTEEAQQKRQRNSSRQFKRYWASLTNAQKQAVRMVYIKNPNKLSKVEIALKLKIRADTFEERLEHAIKKFLKFFPEYDDSKPE